MVSSYFRYEEALVGEGSRVELQLCEFQVVRQTPRGVRINDYTGRSRFISRDWNKQWACPTVEEARQSFMARKRRQVLILKARLARAEEALGKASFGELPDRVGWLPMLTRPDWARGTDETAGVAKAKAKAKAKAELRYAQMQRDYFS